jgi:muramoyltetrapeptide carboxypeptidase
MLALWLGSSPVEPEAFHKGIEALDSKGVPHAILSESAAYLFKPQSKHLQMLAGPDDEKAWALEKIWNDPVAKDIFCIRGGYGNLRILPYLDDCELQKTKKKIWGYSDTTIIQHYLHSRLGNEWVHSPMLSSASFYSPDKKELPLWNKLLSNKPLTEAQCTHKLKIHKKLWPKRKTAKVLGGNLVSLVSMIGTPWEPITKDPFVLFIEEIAENERRLDRALHTLIHSVFFEKCVGVVCGHMNQCENAFEILKDWSDNYQVPIAFGINAGHDRPNLPLLMGAKTHFEQKNGVLTMKTPSFSLRF